MLEQRMMVTGAGGFLGGHICRHFGRLGYPIAAVGRFSTDPELIRDYRNLWKIYGLTLPDKAFITAVREFRPTVLIHCAGTSSVVDSVSEPYTDFQRTVDVCAFTLETVRREVPDCRFILLSSAAVYGNPTQLPVREHSPVEPVSPYGYHKRMCETLVDEYRTLHCISAVVLRIFSAYGERLRRQVVFDLCRKFNNPGSDVVEVYGTGQESRDFIHATDVAQAISCIVLGNATGYFNLGSGKQTTIANLVNQIKKSMNSDKDIHFTGQIRPGDPLCWEADINQLKSLGFSPSITLDAGIKKYCDWFKLDYF
ncbi:MAG: hypothetical protein CVU89_05070 [Firmicutes bacterium HGW-Firmicutes-14]|nr:MAG: hypothetical protein CVU89_05070 [Firmicutes bacterium HGW-Firmicutes-14]